MYITIQKYIRVEGEGKVGGRLELLLSNEGFAGLDEKKGQV